MKLYMIGLLKEHDNNVELIEVEMYMPNDAEKIHVDKVFGSWINLQIIEIDIGYVFDL